MPVISASISEKYLDYLEENNISKSEFVQEKLQEHIEGEEPPEKYVPTKFIKDSCQYHLLLTLLGILLIGISFISSFFSTAVLSVYFSSIAYLVGLGVTIFSVFKYYEWSQALKTRLGSEDGDEEVGE